MWRISTRSFLKRDQFTVLPMPEEVIKMLDAMAAKDGITRATNLFEKKDSIDDADRPSLLVEDDESDDENDETVKGPTMKLIPPNIREEGVNDEDIEDVHKGEEDHAEELEPDVPVKSEQTRLCRFRKMTGYEDQQG
jgi:hypothetical protein